MSSLLRTDIPASLNLYRSIDPRRVVTKRIVTSGVVCPKPLWLYWVKVWSKDISQMVIPVRVEAPDGGWTDIDNVIDEDLSTRAHIIALGEQFTKFLYIYLDRSVETQSIVINCEILGDSHTVVLIGVRCGGSWVQVNAADCENNVWTDIVVPGNRFIDAAYIKAYNDAEGFRHFYVYELRFYCYLNTYLELRNGFSKAGSKPVFELWPKDKHSETMVFSKPMRFNKGLFASFGPAGSFVEFGYVPDY